VRHWRAADLGGGALIGRHQAAAVDLALAGPTIASAGLDRSVRVWTDAGADRVLDAGAPAYAVALAPGLGLILGLTDDRRVVAATAVRSCAPIGPSTTW
jgi:hypothetical protein